LLAPGLGEEAPFRGALVPDRRESIRPLTPILLSTTLFCLWHVAEASTFLPKARPLFLRPDFLAWTVLLGLACAVLRRRSGSLWTAVLLHWAAVVVWEGWLGGPGAAELR
jgi:predicted Abi (CAAX) family protease